MRVNPTVTWVTSEAIEDVDLHGLHIPAGGVVQVLSHSAGTDPAAMPDPAFDITQARPPHLGFGGGVHHCLGHFVARTDMAVALPLLARRMPDACPDGPGRWLPGLGQHRRPELPDPLHPDGGPVALAPRQPPNSPPSPPPPPAPCWPPCTTRLRRLHHHEALSGNAIWSSSPVPTAHHRLQRRRSRP